MPTTTTTPKGEEATPETTDEITDNEIAVEAFDLACAQQRLLLRLARVIKLEDGTKDDFARELLDAGYSLESATFHVTEIFLKVKLSE